MEYFHEYPEQKREDSERPTVSCCSSENTKKSQQLKTKFSVRILEKKLHNKTVEELAKEIMKKRRV